ncbi:MAG TPA: Ig-like domain repeat protein [Ktedonobacterales bacterium]|nr:Ig-like domain repeat protein [Ktedonobacterales bacterium]
MLLAGSGLALRYGTARAASISDSACTSAHYTADLAALTGNDTITFNCPSAATINVTSGAGGPGTVTVASGQTLTIQSVGKPVTLTGAGSAQLFQVKQGGSGPGTLNLSNLTLAGGSALNGGAIITNGVLSLSNCIFSDNTSTEGGGALFVDDLGSATIKGSEFSQNAATGGHTSQGGAIDNTGTLTITNSTFAKNTTIGRLGDSTTSNTGLAGDGGAIYSTGTVTISGSAFTQNTAQGGAGVLDSPGGPAAGGAVDASGGTLTISDSTFSANSATAGAGGPSGTTSAGSTGADAGGGAVNGTVGTTVTVSDSTFVGNSATAGNGGANGMIVAVGTALVLGPGGSAFGGAMDVSGGGVGAVTGSAGGALSGGGVGAVTISASTFTNNTANGGSGPGGAGYAGAMDVSGGGVGAIARGSVAAVAGALSDNIVFGNTASTGGANCVLDPTVTDGGYNLTNTGDTGCGFAPARHDVLTSAPALGTLDNNGGTAQTIALIKGSPALDAIPPDSAATPTGCGVANGPLASDERGVARPQGSGCDIGAYELAPASATQLTADPTNIVLGQTVQLCATVAGTASGTGTPTGTVTFLDGTDTIGTGSLANGRVCISTSGLGLGTHAITASYGGDAQFDPSVSAPVTVTVGINGADVAGAPGSGNNAGASPSGNTGAAGNTSGANGTGQQSQSAEPAGSSGVRLPHASSPAQPAVNGAWPAGLMFALGALLLLGGLSGLAVVMVRAARM